MTIVYKMVEKKVESVFKLYLYYFASNNIFTQGAGSRPKAKRHLIVITDGESQDRENLRDAIRLADQKNIVRFAIGVSCTV